MKVAVVSQDFRSLTGPAGKARRFLVFEAEKGARPVLEQYFQLPEGMPTHHDLHGVVKGSAGAGTALLLELSDDNEVLQALEKNLENLEYEVIDINIGITFKPGTEVPDKPLTA